MDVQSAISLSHQLALRRQLDVIANNIANMNTAGFRREETRFSAMLSAMQRGSPAPDVAMVIDHGLGLDTSAGPIEMTGRALDVAIDGDGWLQVRGADGEILWSRGGHLQILASGALALANGAVLADQGGGAILIPEDQPDIAIASDGTVRAGNDIVGRLTVARFTPGAAIERRGDGLYAASDYTALDAAEVRLRPGAIEGSNVSGVKETAAMVDLLRSYQASQKMADAANDLRRRSIERLGRIN